MRVIELEAYDAILGYDWLKAHSPMVCQWELKTIEFQEKEKLVHLEGIQPGQLELSTISTKQFLKWQKGNDIWAMAIVETANDSKPTPVPAPVLQVLE
jgi:hypothetical protein